MSDQPNDDKQPDNDQKDQPYSLDPHKTPDQTGIEGSQITGNPGHAGAGGAGGQGGGSGGGGGQGDFKQGHGG